MMFSTLTPSRFVLLVSFGLFACSTAPRVDISSSADPQAKIAEVERRRESAIQNQYDQLSPTHFREAEVALKEARQKSEKGAPSERILDDVSKAFAQFDLVDQNGKKNGEVMKTAMDARTAAKGVKADTTLPREFKAADEQLQGFAEDMEDREDRPTAERISKLEGRYADLELLSLKHANLDEARSLIEKAEKDGAKEKTPNTFATAQVQFDSAARAIEANRRRPDAYEAAVVLAVSSAKKLNQVLKTVVESKTSEVSAVQIFDQQRQLAANAVSLQHADEKGKSNLDKIQVLKGQNQEYAQDKALQQKIEKLKATFNPSEAAVVHEGNKITVRLKSMQFSPARFELAGSSLNTLQKVREMILSVPTTSVVVEGHTDSIGTSEANLALSQKRADAVKQYLVSTKAIDENQIEAKGLGYDQPLTANKSKAGRATNRRVDIVILTSAR